MTLAQHFSAYGQWRNDLADRLAAFKSWLSESDMGNDLLDSRLARLLEGLRDDHLLVAFIAEFSRGKSELINAIFFGDYGRRMLPSTAGRTTMCPTELLYDKHKPPQIELLPIQTRATEISIGDYRRSPHEWVHVPLDVDSPGAMKEALRSVSEVLQVSPEMAEEFGFRTTSGSGGKAGESAARVEIPRWRHAVINFPHPLLEHGLTILDTPGLNAVGMEPELTLSLLPGAHAVLYVLAADAGVTQSDLALWNEHVVVADKKKRGRIIVLNKIDGLWDELRQEDEINAEIERQVKSCAAVLGVPAGQVFPISAQKALVAKVNGDAALLARSRLPALERALAEELIPAKQEIVRESNDAEFKDIYSHIDTLLASRLENLREQLVELGELRGKNRGVVEHMMSKAHDEKQKFEAGLKHFYATRSLFSQRTNHLFAHLGPNALRPLVSATRKSMNEAVFSANLAEAMDDYFAALRAKVVEAEKEIGEILSLMTAVYRKFDAEHGLNLGTPSAFSLLRHQKEINKLKRWCDTHLNTRLRLFTQGKQQVTQRFFGEVAAHGKQIFAKASKGAESWLRAVMLPLESQVREHQRQLKRRLESILRIHQATETLEERIDELKQTESLWLEQQKTAERYRKNVQAALEAHRS